nr:unnamed protein product [Haemonchus contortus]
MYIHIHLAHVKMMSTQTRRSHQQLLMVLLLQTACPIVLLHIPLYTMGYPKGMKIIGCLHKLSHDTQEYRLLALVFSLLLLQL